MIQLNLYFHVIKFKSFQKMYALLFISTIKLIEFQNPQLLFQLYGSQLSNTLKISWTKLSNGNKNFKILNQLLKQVVAYKKD